MLQARSAAEANQNGSFCLGVPALLLYLPLSLYATRPVRSVQVNWYVVPVYTPLTNCRVCAVRSSAAFAKSNSCGRGAAARELLSVNRATPSAPTYEHVCR